MKELEIVKLAAWVADAGLKGAAETTLVECFCERAAAAGLPLARALVLMDTLHPVHEGRAFRWVRDKPLVVNDYGRTDRGEMAERWHASPFYRMLEAGESVVRRLVTPEIAAEFPQFAEQMGAAIGEMDCVYSSFMTDRPGGFADDEVLALERLTPHLGLAVKAASLARIAETLVETYLGRDAGRRVLQGRIERGVVDRIKTVLWFSDLRNYTRIADNADPEQIIPLLNDYADAVVSAIHNHSGDVLKFIGDGVLAIFPAENRARACAAALNEVARIAAMCRSVDQPVLISSAFAASVDKERRHFASVGRFALRGVGKPQELYTLDAEGERPAEPLPTVPRKA